MIILKNYYFEGEKFIIEDYLKKSTFSNFLPGLAGKNGIPLWAFYVNRGQGISGFGLQDKNHPIMEYTPANKAYESVGQIGFRTFIKTENTYYEPFRPTNKYPHRMTVERTSFTIEEENIDLGIKITVKYFGLPNENIGALIRKVSIKNISKKDINIELLDGLTEIIPSGVSNSAFKDISNLLCSWMDVEELENDYAFYNLRSSTGDTSEVTKIESGNYLLGVVDGKLVKPIVDQDIVFGFDNAKLTAEGFIEKNFDELIKTKQVTVNKLPCGFIPVKKTLKSDEAFTIDIISGFAHSKAFIKDFIVKASSKDYIDQKELEAKQLVEDIVNDVKTNTGSKLFNEYIKQSYLDNLLRGGYPMEIGNQIYHLFSRRHGDLERDYNFFSLAPEFYSQGGGNFRDVCQNRRLDSFIHPEVKAHNIKHFASLIQLDGYNPLTINGLTFKVIDQENLKPIIEKHFLDELGLVRDFLKNKFSPGGLVSFINNNDIQVLTSEELYLNDIVNSSRAEYESNFGEGYWVDHFSYILDLIESYEGIYPDKIEELLYQEEDILTFESPVSVLKRDEKAVLNNQGLIRQYGSLLHNDNEKIEKLNLNVYGSNWVTINHRRYQTNLFVKLLILVLNKHAQLDSQGFGVEMESEKPGWNDAMNGLPGLFGSGVSEAIELKRIVNFLIKHHQEEELLIPREIATLYQNLSKNNSYESRLTAREKYRESTRFGLSGEMTRLSSISLQEYLVKLDKYIFDKLNELFKENPIIPTFIKYDVTEYEQIKDDGKDRVGNYGLPLVKPIEYKRHNLPKFLEAPARLLKIDFEKDKLKSMYDAIKESDIYDKKLLIYKTSEPLDNESFEIGRIRAFTPGWLERESDFLHMIYKYLLGLLKSGLYEEFYNEINNNLVCYMDPNKYGRNTLENSSYIVPSNNPNEKIHGKGYQPRLSGSTVEVLDMWATMMTGGKPFKLKENNLIFKPTPLFSKEFFTEDFTVSFKFMKNINITYISDNKFNTYDSCNIVKYELYNEDVKEVVYQDYVEKNQAKLIRDGFYKEIKIYIKK
jgi:hypothetical protein